MHAKYEVWLSYGSKLTAKVKVFATESQTERTKLRCPRIPFREHKNERNVYENEEITGNYKINDKILTPGKIRFFAIHVIQKFLKDCYCST